MAFVWIFPFGVALLAFVAWARAGRSPAAKWWPGNIWNEGAILCVLPAFGLMCVIGTAMAALGDPAERPLPLALLAVCTFFALVGAMLLGLWGLLLIPIPERWFPKWAWPKSRTRRDRIKRAARKKERREQRERKRAQPHA